MSFHLWHSANNIIEDLVQVHLFQRTLIGLIAKWYVNKPLGTYITFECIAKEFLSFSQFPIHHDTRLEILTRHHYSTTTHIANHIHEWHRRCSIYKIDVEWKFLLDWFFKSMLPPISKYVAMGMPETKDEAILKSQTFEFIHAQSRYLYSVLPHAPRPTSSMSPTLDISYSSNGLFGYAI